MSAIKRLADVVLDKADLDYSTREQRPAAEAVVRAILEAIRDPDDETWDRLWHAAMRAAQFDGLERGSDNYTALSTDAPQLIWDAMIDKLLEP